MTNLELAKQFREMAAAYLILGENRFRIMAYERAADSIEHLTGELKDMWKAGKLGDIPGIGSTIAGYIDELYKTGKVKHFSETLSKLPNSVFPLLLVPGLGPKKAYKLVTELELHNPDTVVADLEKAIHDHRVATMEGFGPRSEEVIRTNISAYKKGQIKENRLVLPEADAIAQEILSYLRILPEVSEADPLGSLRRKVSTIGDIDIAVATEKPEVVIRHFVKYPNQKIIDQGPGGATILLHNGRQADLRVQHPGAYGAMLQYFTGSKNHNIKLRTLALGKGLSLNEHGIKNTKTGVVKEYRTEESFYKAIDLPWIPPEIREDHGEIEVAQKGMLPDLVAVSAIKGDLHIHADFVFPTSHDLGQSPLEAYLDQAASYRYEYIGISDHNPRISGLTAKEIAAVMKKRKQYYEDKWYSWKERTGKRVHLFIMCEVDILTDGKLALPEEAFEFVDGVVVSLHSAFTQPREVVTERIITALTAHRKVRIMGHPTGRLINKREGVDADWPAVFAVCKERNIALEINAFPDRLDLPDGLVFDARKQGVKFTIDTDSHMVDHMQVMPYGVSVARRGWAEPRDILNTQDYNTFCKWLLRKE